MKDFINDRFKSIGIAFKGLYLLIRTESNIKVQLAIGSLVTLIGLSVGLSPTEWILQTFAIALVMSAEGLNTAVEKIADVIHPDHNTAIGFIKDIAAGAVLITALAAIVVGCIIYIPKLM
ncbi:MAG: diacylglycerol kinase family protein [Bacteroidota bacterium]